MNDRKYTKGDCYALCEFLDALTMHNPGMIADSASVLGYDKERLRDLLIRLSCDIDYIIAKEQDERDDTDQMADIMQLVHIPGHDDYKKQSLLPDDYKSMLRGEIASAIYHNPTDDEFEKFEQYVHDYIADCIDENKTPDLTGACCAIHDCRDECFKECAECGEYFMPDEMNPDDISYCRSCKPVYDPDVDWEWEKQNKVLDN